MASIPPPPKPYSPIAAIARPSFGPLSTSLRWRRRRWRWCPRRRVAALYQTIAHHLEHGRIPPRQRRLLAAHYRRHARQPLDAQAFDQYMRDDWAWKAAFAVTNASYGAGKGHG